MTLIDEMRDDLSRVLGRAEQWFDGLTVLADDMLDTAQIAVDAKRLSSLRTRALATQLNVGLLGRQSAGKSFLISGLQGGLQYFKVTDEDGDYSEEYRGLLPSSANPTTACPSTVVPVQDGAAAEAAGRGLLRVRFADRGWVDIGKNLAPAVVAAYGASDGHQTDRLEDDHINRRVEEMELLISDFRLPVKLFDLPGAESVIEEHSLIMRNAWKEADCFLYVSQGTSALTVNELDLIRELYAEHLQTGKPVLWVLTGIDRATQKEHDQAAWKNVLATNNAYLAEHFPSADGTGGRFIGEGFIPVSAAWEAQAEAAGIDTAERESLRRRSRMDGLRVRLAKLIESGAGQRHLAQVANEARLTIRRAQRPIADTLATDQISAQELENEKAAVNARLDRANRGTEQLTSQLSAALERSIHVSQRPFGDLAAALHRDLDKLIDSGSLDAKHTSEVNVRQVQLFSQWMAKPGSPDDLWRRELANLDAQARTMLQGLLEVDAATGSQLVAPDRLDLDGLLVATDGRRPMTIYGMVKATAGAVGVASTILGGVAQVATSVGIATIAFPVAATVAAAIAAAKIADAVKSRESAVQRDRNIRKLMIDNQAERAKEDFAKATREQGTLLIDAARAYVQQHQSRLWATLHQIHIRIDAPDSVATRERVARLTPVNRRALELLDTLDALIDGAKA